MGNSLEYAKIFQPTLDKQLIEGATSGWMEENAGRVKYNGGNEVKIPKISMDGLADYDREKGFVEGGIDLAYETKIMTQDRGRTFHLDAMDVDETNFVADAGNVMGEFQRTKVIPEVDAYRYSLIATLAKSADKVTKYTPDADTILKTLLADIANIRDICGDSVELVITMSTPVQSVLSSAKETSKIIDTTNFKKGDLNLKVKGVDDTPIISVPSARMKTEYNFFDGTTTGQSRGGFEATDEAEDINWLITARRAPMAISKTDVTRVFNPLENQKAHAWKIDYRKYHDLWIAENQMDGIWVNIK